MFDLDVVKVVGITLGWLYLEELKGIFGECTKFVCQLGRQVSNCIWKNPRIHTSFDKVNIGPMFKIISSPIFIFYKWPHKPQTKVKAFIVDHVHLRTH